MLTRHAAQRRPAAAADLAGFRATDNWFQNKHGILEAGELAHLPLAHAMRTHPRVAAVFAALYGVESGLVVAQDRLNYQLPSEWLPHARASLVPADPADIARRSEGTSSCPLARAPPAKPAATPAHVPENE